mgnify:CR=1 FL=1
MSRACAFGATTSATEKCGMPRSGVTPRCFYLQRSVATRLRCVFLFFFFFFVFVWLCLVCCSSWHWFHGCCAGVGGLLRRCRGALCCATLLVVTVRLIFVCWFVVQVEARLVAGQDPNAYERHHGMAAIHFAAARGHAAIIRLLVKHHATATAKTVSVVGNAPCAHARTHASETACLLHSLPCLTLFRPLPPLCLPTCSLTVGTRFISPRCATHQAPSRLFFAQTSTSETVIGTAIRRACWRNA